MPGIVAVIDSKNCRPVIDSMIRSITHEEWQRSDTYLRPPLAVGRVHLGIVNTEPQPIFNEDQSVLIVMDGEVFDYASEKKRLESLGHDFKIGNDSEFCLHLFEQYGLRSFERLNGAFVIVIYDTKRQEIIVANDRHGLIPLYYAKNGERHIFASEVKAILEDKTFIKEVDEKSVADFFAFGRIFGNKTLLKGIRLVTPGSVMVWSGGKISEEKYWDFSFQEDCRHALSEEHYVNTLVSLFKKGVDVRTRDEHRFGVFLSGGMDSRTTVGAFDKACYPLRTFTYGIEGGDEARIAEKVAGQLKTEHEFTELKGDYLVSLAEKGVYLTDGMLNCIHFYWLSVLPEVRKKVDVMFHGLGLDILLSTVMSHSMFAHFFGGGSGLLLERHLSKAKEGEFSELLYRFFNSLVSEEAMPLFFSKRYYQKIKGCPRQSLEEQLSMVKEKDPVDKLDSFWLRLFGRYNLSRVILRNYCEERVPSMDNDFFEFALRVPVRFRFRYQELYFRFLAKLAPDLARIPYERTGVAPIMPIPAHRISFLIRGAYKFLARKLKARTRGLILFPVKMGYPDLGESIRTDGNLRSFFENTLLDKKTLEREYFNSGFVTQIVKDHMSGKKDWSMLLCALLTFELWHRLFID
jgi:asparagine synthase (glutamine-hydrolysing)